MNNPVLYILMRTDLDSLNPGKAMAQAAHAADLCRDHMQDVARDRSDLYQEWIGSSGSFGTTIVLGGRVEQINKSLQNGRDFNDIMPVDLGWVLDPTYPIRDGKVTHEIPLHTCAFVFGRKADCQFAVGNLELHP